ncbi:MAG: TetR/AcrR family transcriptional regulator [Gammaproteobacteria bacterium]|nr:TetR/AcrR family transcriptional regulator [Gammaproteobacteria bacterium]
MSISTQTMPRKQRELLQREELILDAAQTMMHEHGYNYITMDRIAETVEYSKGTIYNHFTSKEDLVCSLCCRCITNLVDIFERAYQYQGSTRERYSAIGIGYSLHHQLHPMDSQNIQTVKNNSVREKVSDEKLAEMQFLEQKITKIAQSIVQEAIDCGDLDKKHQQHVQTIVFGCWSMHYGALLLDQSDIPLHDLGFSPVVKMLWKNANIYLDGYQWLPLSADTDSKKLFEKISSALFADEIKKLTI